MSDDLLNLLRKFLRAQGRQDFIDQYTASDSNQEEFNKNLRRWLVEDRRPVSIVNDDNFLKMIQSLDPKIYIPPYKCLFRKYGMAEEFEKYKIKKRNGSKRAYRITRSGKHSSHYGE